MTVWVLYSDSLKKSLCFSPTHKQGCPHIKGFAEQHSGDLTVQVNHSNSYSGVRVLFGFWKQRKLSPAKSLVQKIPYSFLPLPVPSSGVSTEKLPWKTIILSKLFFSCLQLRKLGQNIGESEKGQVEWQEQSGSGGLLGTSMHLEAHGWSPARLPRWSPTPGFSEGHLSGRGAQSIEKSIFLVCSFLNVGGRCLINVLEYLDR